MTKQIDAETLREWLESRQPVTVLDIRTNEDRAQWAIPGSVHVNAYEALREGRPGADDAAPCAFSSRRPPMPASAAKCRSHRSILPVTRVSGPMPIPSATGV